MEFIGNKFIETEDERYVREEIEDLIIERHPLLHRNWDKLSLKPLLNSRKRILNNWTLPHQKELLPIIIEFNDALTKAMREMYDKAHLIWKDLKKHKEYGEDVELTARCFLQYTYPPLHPIQSEKTYKGENVRQLLWDMLCDEDDNPLYRDEVSFPLRFSFDERFSKEEEEMSFDGLIGMDSPPPNWNEGLDRELTKDLHLIQQFHNLFDHTNFALTDFIYVREFHTEIKIEIEN